MPLADLDGEVAENGEVLLTSCRVGLNGEAPSVVARDGLDRSGNTISLFTCAVLGPLAGGGQVSC